MLYIFLSFNYIIYFLAILSGRSIYIRESNLPGLSKALSKLSGLFVAAIIITFFNSLSPSN